MSVSCEAYVGFTVTLKENLTHDDFDFFNDFEEEHGEYSQYCFKSKDKDRVRLIVDGMCGEFARLVFVEHKINECWVDGKDYFALKNPPIPDNVYDELNKAYKLMYNKELDKSLIEYAFWFVFG